MIAPPSPVPSPTILAPDTKTTVAGPPAELTDPVAAPATPKQTLPYKWGKYQGWVSLIVGAFAALYAIVSLLSGATMDERSTGYAIASPLLIVSGYAFIRRKKYALTMTYVWMIFHVGIFIFRSLGVLTSKLFTPEQQEDFIGTGIGPLLAALLFWGILLS